MKILRIVFLPIAFLPLLLTACGIAPQRQADVAYYDLSGTPPLLPAPLRSLDVTPSAWMNGDAMYYRLAYVADGSRRERYGESRWSAQPADLIEVRLKRSLMGGEAASASGKAVANCRLRIDLDDLAQVFDSPQASHLQLDARAALYGADRNLLARKVFSLSRPAGRDAKGGVAASGALVNDFAHRLQDWARQSCR